MTPSKYEATNVYICTCMQYTILPRHSGRDYYLGEPKRLIFGDLQLAVVSTSLNLRRLNIVGRKIIVHGLLEFTSTSL